jgi:hypothetical protein
VDEFDVNGSGRVLWAASIPTSVRRVIRRLRQSPHLTADEVWIFYHEFCVDLEAGTGVANGDGTDPQLMLQYSKDGGHTWSSERWTSAGKQGEYALRAMWRRLGRARDMVFRLTVADPVRWTLLDAFVEIERGTN